MKALVLTEKGHPTKNFHAQEIEKPSPLKNEILVKIKVAALNPVDYKMAEYGFLIKDAIPIVLGCDMSGIVEAVGSDVTRFKAGDEVCGFTELGTKGHGTFAEYCLISEDLAFKKNPSISHEVSSTFGVGSLTASLGIFVNMNIPLPSKNEQSKLSQEYFLVWGAAGSVGSFAVQLATLAGFKVLATASKRNFDLVKSLGAVEVFDYSESDVVEKIQQYSKGSMVYGYDSVSTNETILSSVSCLSKEKECFLSGTSVCNVPLPSNVKYKQVQLGAMPNNPQVRSQMAPVTIELSDLIQQGKLKGTQVHILEGIDNIVPGIELLLQNKVSGKKIVFTIS